MGDVKVQGHDDIRYKASDNADDLEMVSIPEMQNEIREIIDAAHQAYRKSASDTLWDTLKIQIKDVGSSEDLQRWEDQMLVKAKCWNQFCDGLYNENEIRAVHV